MMANWETSAEISAVVGMKISDGPGLGTSSTPSKSRIRAPTAGHNADTLVAVHGVAAVRRNDDHITSSYGGN
jgi:hypothetical protein